MPGLVSDVRSALIFKFNFYVLFQERFRHEAAPNLSITKKNKKKNVNLVVFTILAKEMVLIDQYERPLTLFTSHTHKHIYDKVIIIFIIKFLNLTTFTLYIYIYIHIVYLYI